MLIIKYAELAEKGYTVIKAIAIAFVVVFIIIIGTSIYKNKRQNQYLAQLDQTAVEVIENVEMQILGFAKETGCNDIEEVNEVLKELNGIEVVTNKTDNIVFIKSENMEDEQWDMEVNWHYGTSNMSVIVYDPTRTYMWSNHFPKERFELY